jgi:hypothetical protein
LTEPIVIKTYYYYYYYYYIILKIPLQAFLYSHSYLLNVKIQAANKAGVFKKNQYSHYQPCLILWFILILSMLLRLGRPNGLFPVRVPTSILVLFLYFLIDFTCPANIILHDVIVIIVLVEQYELDLVLINNPVAWVRERTIPTERTPLIGEFSTNFLRIEGATWSAWRIPTAVFSDF